MLYPPNVSHIYHLVATAIEASETVTTIGQSLLLFICLKTIFVVFCLSKTYVKSKNMFNCFPNISKEKAGD